MGAGSGGTYTAAGDARASAERAEWLTGWSALSVGDARGRRGLSGDGFAEPEGKGGACGGRPAGLGRWSGCWAVTGKGRGERGPGLGLVWAGIWGLAGFWVFFGSLFLTQTKFEFK